MQNTLINIGFYLTYFMLIVATLSAIIFPIIFMVNDPKKAKATLIGVAALLIVFGISYAISGNELYGALLQNHSISKLVGGGIVMFYILFVGAIFLAIYSEVARFFK